jgi:hypothetical protein
MRHTEEDIARVFLKLKENKPIEKKELPDVYLAFAPITFFAVITGVYAWFRGR